MKKAFLLFTLIFLSIVSYCQEITGQWNGVLKFQGMQLRIVFHISETDDGYKSTMDSPDQGAKGIPVTSTSFDGKKVVLKVANAGITYEGTLISETELDGTFSQGGQDFPIKFTKNREKVEGPKRPQLPQKPYPYHTEDVVFKNKQAGISLAGTLSIPKKDGKFPAVILISGSGPQNRDEELFGHKPFLVLADHLTKKGFAVLRYDDRGTAGSEGDFKTATSADFACDVKAALAFLKTRTEIDDSQIGLIGHSEGAMIAPMIAAETDNDISFVVLMAGPGKPGHEVLLLQQKLIAEAMQIDEAKIQESQITNKQIFDIVLNSTSNEVLKKDLQAFLMQKFEETPDEDIPDGMDKEQLIKLQLDRITSPWMVYFLKFDPATYLEKVSCPVLAINGEKDLQVPSKINLEGIKNSLHKGGNSQVKTVEIPGLNHLFQECKIGMPAEYGSIEQTFSPIALNEISNWLIKQIK